MDSPIALLYEGGSTTSSLAWEVSNLGHVGVDTPLFLRVEIWPTEFEIGFADVYVNGIAIVDHCSPNEDCGSEWYTCVTSLMVLPFVDSQLGGSLTVTIQTSAVHSSACNYGDQNEYMLYAKMALNSTRFDLSQSPSGQPSGQPSVAPSGEPTSPSSEPSGQPTRQPSPAPTSVPSGDAHISQSYITGSSNESVVWNAHGLGVMSGPLYLTVKVYPTSFAETSTQQAMIYVDGNLINGFCRPGADCGLDFYTCLSDVDVADFVTMSQGGSLLIEVKTVDVYSTECDHKGYPLYVDISLSDQLTATSSGRARKFN
jgi:hypothetical protein